MVGSLRVFIPLSCVASAESLVVVEFLLYKEVAVGCVYLLVFLFNFAFSFSSIYFVFFYFFTLEVLFLASL